MQREGTLIVMILKMKNDFWCLPLLVYFTNSFWQVKNPCLLGKCGVSHPKKT